MSILELWASVFTSRSQIYVSSYFYSLFSKWIFLVWKKSSYIFNRDVWRTLNCSGCDGHWRPLVTGRLERSSNGVPDTPQPLRVTPPAVVLPRTALRRGWTGRCRRIPPNAAPAPPVPAPLPGAEAFSAWQIQPHGARWERSRCRASQAAAGPCHRRARGGGGGRRRHRGAHAKPSRGLLRGTSGSVGSLALREGRAQPRTAARHERTKERAVRPRAPRPSPPGPPRPGALPAPPRAPPPAPPRAPPGLAHLRAAAAPAQWLRAPALPPHPAPIGQRSRAQQRLAGGPVSPARPGPSPRPPSAGLGLVLVLVGGSGGRCGGRAACGAGDSPCRGAAGAAGATPAQPCADRWDVDEPRVPAGQVGPGTPAPPRCGPLRRSAVPPPARVPASGVRCGRSSAAAGPAGAHPPGPRRLRGARGARPSVAAARGAARLCRRRWRSGPARPAGRCAGRGGGASSGAGPLPAGAGPRSGSGGGPAVGARGRRAAFRRRGRQGSPRARPLAGAGPGSPAGARAAVSARPGPARASARGAAGGAGDGACEARRARWGDRTGPAAFGGVRAVRGSGAERNRPVRPRPPPDRRSKLGNSVRVAGMALCRCC